MFFFPFRMDSRKEGLPLLTVLVCLVCLWVYWEQYTQDRAYFEAIDKYCLERIEKDVLLALQLVRHEQTGNYCFDVFNEIREAPKPLERLEELARSASKTGLFEKAEDEFANVFLPLSEGYRQYERQVPLMLTSELSYKPGELDIWNMLTATFSHGDIWHLLGNLLFFYIFAASVELVVGHLVFAGFILVGAVGTSLAYSYAMIGVEDALPTVGLSGIVMAMVAALALMLPHARINCLLWFGIIIRIIPVPAMFLAVWYIGWDIYEMQSEGNTSGINYTAHVSGAVMGALFGLYYTLFEKKRVREATVFY